jgi:hypothetical protein
LEQQASDASAKQQSLHTLLGSGYLGNISFHNSLPLQFRHCNLAGTCTKVQYYSEIIYMLKNAKLLQDYPFAKTSPFTVTAALQCFEEQSIKSIKGGPYVRSTWMQMHNNIDFKTLTEAARLLSGETLGARVELTLLYLPTANNLSGDDDEQNITSFDLWSALSTDIAKLKEQVCFVNSQMHLNSSQNEPNSSDISFTAAIPTLNEDTLPESLQQLLTESTSLVNSHNESDSSSEPSSAMHFQEESTELTTDLN